MGLLERWAQVCPAHSARKYPGTIYANAPRPPRAVWEAACACSPARLKVVLSPAGLICYLRALSTRLAAPQTPPGVSRLRRKLQPARQSCARWEVNSDWQPRATLPKASGETYLLHPTRTRPPLHTGWQLPPRVWGRRGPHFRDLSRLGRGPGLLQASKQRRQVGGGWGNRQRGEGPPPAGQRAEPADPGASGRVARGAGCRASPVQTIHDIINL